MKKGFRKIKSAVLLVCLPVIVLAAVAVFSGQLEFFGQHKTGLSQTDTEGVSIHYINVVTVSIEN